LGAGPHYLRDDDGTETQIQIIHILQGDDGLEGPRTAMDGAQANIHADLWRVLGIASRQRSAQEAAKG